MKPRVYILTYCIGNEFLVKIGVTSNIQKRVKQLQMPVKPVLCLARNCRSIFEARAIETFMLKCPPWNTYRSEGEWLIFKNTDDARSFLNDFIDRLEGLISAFDSDEYFQEIKIKQTIR